MNKKLILSVVGVVIVFGGLVWLTNFYIGSNADEKLSSSGAASLNVDLLPVANGTYQEWEGTQPVGATHWSAVDDTTCAGSADFVYTLKAGARESYKLNLSLIPDGSKIDSLAIYPCAGVYQTDVRRQSSRNYLSLFYRLDGKDGPNSPHDRSPNSGDPVKDLLPVTYNFSGTKAGSITKTSSTALELVARFDKGNRGMTLNRLAARVSYTAPAVATAPAPAPAEAFLGVSLSSDTNSSVSNNASVVAGTQTIPFTRYSLSALGSGEDVKVSSIALRLGFSAPNTGDDLTNCILRDVTNGEPGGALNTGGNVVNPSNTDTSGVLKLFTFDAPLVVTKNTTKTLLLSCNLVSGALGGQTYNWGVTSDQKTASAVGVTSGVFVPTDAKADNGRTITAMTSGALFITLDASSPALRLVQAGSTDNVLAVLRVNANDEAIRLDTLGLQLGSPLLNTPSDLTKVTVWNGATKVGEAVFSASDFATATLTGVTVQQNGQLLLTIKGDMAGIGTGLSGRSGHLVKVEYDADNSSTCRGGVNTNCNRGLIGVGRTSGSSISAGNVDSVSNGAYLVKTIPSVTKIATTGRYTVGMDRSIYNFALTNKATGNGFYKFTFRVISNDQSKISNFRVYCYSDAAMTVPACGNTNGLLNQFNFAVPSPADNGNVIILFNPTAVSSGVAEAIQVPASTSRYFRLTADIADGAGTIYTIMKGDATVQNVACDKDAGTAGVCIGPETFTNTAPWINSLAGDRDFIWSDNATNTSTSVNAHDWMNGFLVPGLSNNDSDVAEVVTP